MKQAHETRGFRIYYVKLWEEITVRWKVEKTMPDEFT